MDPEPLPRQYLFGSFGVHLPRELQVREDAIGEATPLPQEPLDREEGDLPFPGYL